MSNWIKVRIEDIGEVVGGSTPSTKNDKYYGGDIAWITPKDLSNFDGRFISSGERNITEAGLESCSARLLPKHTVLFTSRAPIGYIAIASNDLATNQGFKSIIPNEKIDYLFLYYLLKYNKDKIESVGSGTTFKEVSGASMKKIEVRIPQDKREQKRIAAILSSLDDKIEINTRMNKVLEETARALFHRWFVEFEFPNDEGKPYKSSGGRMIASEMGEIPEGWTIKRAQEICNISIGKTPPRKETQWFTSNSSDVKWISISDMGSSGMFVLDSSEYLTVDAIEKFNIVTVPKDTVILSFKLTIGRVSITSEDLVTNEAIAHFKTNIQELREYLYFTLKCYDYVSLGSTSSIATAINSKIIKNMNILLPHINLIKDYHALVLPIFEIIRTNQTEINQLKKIRETVLPKLMGGGIIS